MLVELRAGSRSRAPRYRLLESWIADIDRRPGEGVEPAPTAAVTQSLRRGTNQPTPGGRGPDARLAGRRARTVTSSASFTARRVRSTDRLRAGDAGSGLRSPPASPPFPPGRA